MPTITYTGTRRLQKDESIPYDLLLLADEELQAIDRYIHESDLYVVEADNKIVGVYALWMIDEDTAEIKAIAVDENYQNNGIGKFMLQDAEIKAWKKGCHEVIIGTPTIAAKQLAIYQKAGFEFYKIKKDFFIHYYSKPVFEGGVLLTDMAMLRKKRR